MSKAPKSIDALRRHYEGLLSEEGLAPLDDAEPGHGGRMRQPPIPEPKLTHGEQESWRLLAEAFATGDLACLHPSDQAKAETPLYRRRRRGDARLAAHMAECRPIVELARSMRRDKYHKPLYSRLERLKAWVARMQRVHVEDATSAPRNDAEQRGFDTLGIFAEAQVDFAR